MASGEWLTLGTPPFSYLLSDKYYALCVGGAVIPPEAHSEDPLVLCEVEVAQLQLELKRMRQSQVLTNTENLRLKQELQRATIRIGELLRERATFEGKVVWRDYGRNRCCQSADAIYGAK
jgi:hypothetical protein